MYSKKLSIFCFLAFLATTGFARTHVKLSDTAEFAEEEESSESSVTEGFSATTEESEAVDGAFTYPGVTEGYESYEVDFGEICDLSCEEISQCMSDAEYTCDVRCAPTLGECQDVFYACDDYVSEQGWMNNASDAYSECDDDSGYELTCYDDEELRFRRSIQPKKVQGTPGPPPTQLHGSLHNGDLPPLTGKHNCAHVDTSCWDRCLRMVEGPCFRGCPKPSTAEILIMKTCENYTYGLVDSAFDRCMQEYNSFQQQPDGFRPEMPREFKGGQPLDPLAGPISQLDGTVNPFQVQLPGGIYENGPSNWGQGPPGQMSKGNSNSRHGAGNRGANRGKGGGNPRGY